MQLVTSDSQIGYLPMDLVDQLGFLLAEEAAIHSKVEEIKDVLKNLGEGRNDGRLYSATVTLSQRSTINYAKMAEELGVTFPDALIAKHTKTTASIACRVASL